MAACEEVVDVLAPKVCGHNRGDRGLASAIIKTSATFGFTDLLAVIGVVVHGFTPVIIWSAF